MDGISHDSTGENRRNPADAGLARAAAWLLVSIALLSLLLLVSTFLWQVLGACGDLLGESTLLATAVVIAGVWVAHWCGLILLNSLSLARANSRDAAR
ncbi:MAG: hypothetical protein KF774_01315 [Planctomyces sp.]|nr:hypothetical protein [Planctomyces sp.]